MKTNSYNSIERGTVSEESTLLLAHPCDKPAETSTLETTTVMMTPPSYSDDARLRRQGTRRPRGARGKTRCLILVALVGVALLFFMSLLSLAPTQHELDLAYDNHLSAWSVTRIREAQSLALSSAKFLNAESAYWDSQEAHDLVKKITRHKSSASQEYMEPPEGCESTVLIVRHCEKGSIREHCAHVGFERAVYLATLFGDHSDERWPSPSFIFAEGPGQRHNAHKMNFREMETVGPLSEKVGVKVDDSYTTETVNQLAREILTVLQSGQMCGKLTLISWKHSNIGHLAHRLGCGPEQGCPMDYRGSSFDSAWQIKFTYRKPEHSSHKDLTLSRHPVWNIAGSVQPEGFDPLAFSKHAGDYPKGGTSSGGRWEKSAISFPERSKHSSTQWKATKVGFDESNNNNNNDNERRRLTHQNNGPNEILVRKLTVRTISENE